MTLTQEKFDSIDQDISQKFIDAATGEQRIGYDFDLLEITLAFENLTLEEFSSYLKQRESPGK